MKNQHTVTVIENEIKEGQTGRLLAVLDNELVRIHYWKETKSDFDLTTIAEDDHLYVTHGEFMRTHMVPHADAFEIQRKSPAANSI